MRVLVCGGAGYIGSNMTAILAAEGFEPVVFDNFSKGHRAAISNAQLVEGDLADHDLIVQTLKEHNIQAVMHFAAFTEVSESVSMPLEYYRNNLANTLTLLSAMQQANVANLVFSSTAAVYGMPEEVPITEEMAKQPVNPYGETKWAAERLCHYQSQSGKLRYASLRYFNACGAGHNATLGEDHHPESHLIPLAIQAAMGKRSEVKIFGTDYPTPDGTCIRDYIHVEDLCRAHLLALNKLKEKSELVYNLGNGTGYSVREVIDTIRKVSGKDFKVIKTDRRPGDPAVLTSDASKAAAQLQWKPKFTSLEEIVATSWQWHNKHPNGYED